MMILVAGGVRQEIEHSGRLMDPALMRRATIFGLKKSVFPIKVGTHQQRDDRGEKMKRLLFLKVFASYLVLILLALAVLDFFLTPRITELITKGIEDEMLSLARTIAVLPEESLKGRLPEIAASLNVRVTLVDAAGRVTADSGADVAKMDNHLDRPEIQQAIKEGSGKASRFSNTIRESMLYVAQARKDGGGITGYIRLARSLAKVGESLDHFYRVFYLTLYIIAIPSILLAFFFTRGITSKLGDRP
jgi:two-component system phosphate regulon sensor histidine kinase PhoR